MKTEQIRCETTHSANSDVLRGVRAISEWIGMPQEQTAAALRKGILPGFKLPDTKIWLMRKSTYWRCVEEAEAARLDAA